MGSNLDDPSLHTRVLSMHTPHPHFSLLHRLISSSPAADLCSFPLAQACSILVRLIFILEICHGTIFSSRPLLMSPMRRPVLRCQFHDPATRICSPNGWVTSFYRATVESMPRRPIKISSPRPVFPGSSRGSLIHQHHVRHVTLRHFGVLLHPES